MFVLKTILFPFPFLLYSSCTSQRIQSFSVTTISYFKLSLLQAKRVILNNFNQNGRCPKFLLQFPNTKFHKNPFDGSRAFADSETDWSSDGYFGAMVTFHIWVWRNSTMRVLQTWNFEMAQVGIWRLAFKASVGYIRGLGTELKTIFLCTYI